MTGRTLLGRPALFLLAGLVLAFVAIDRHSPLRIWIHRTRVAVMTPPVSVGSSARPLSVLSIDGTRVTILKPGKPVIVQVFTTWCPSCRQDVAVMKQAAQRLRRQGVDVIALDQDESVATVASFAKSSSITYPVYIDDGTASIDVYRVHMLPTLLFFDQRRVLRARVEGPLATAQLMMLARRNSGRS